MNGTIERKNYEQLVCEKSESDIGNFSGYSMASVAGGILLCLGIILYAVLTH